MSIQYFWDTSYGEGIYPQQDYRMAHNKGHAYDGINTMATQKEIIYIWQAINVHHKVEAQYEYQV